MGLGRGQTGVLWWDRAVAACDAFTAMLRQHVHPPLRAAGYRRTAATWAPTITPPAGDHPAPAPLRMAAARCHHRRRVRQRVPPPARPRRHPRTGHPVRLDNLLGFISNGATEWWRTQPSDLAGAYVIADQGTSAELATLLDAFDQTAAMPRDQAKAECVHRYAANANAQL
jgi:hypothetical protein